MARYQQQQLVSEIGSDGQKKIETAKVLIIGAGGLGTPVATYLASAGVGCIGIVDGDVISLSNLHRQFLYTDAEVGLGKSYVLAGKLKNMNPEIAVSSYPLFLDEQNGAEILRKYDVVCDCTDDVETRILIDKMCHDNQKPLVYAAILEWEGYLTVLNHNSKIRLGDIFLELSLREHAANSCSVFGIVNTTCGIVGSMQAAEVLKIILGINSNVDGGILCINTMLNSYRLFKIKNKRGES